MNLQKLDTLKEKLEISENLADVWNYFFDHFGHNQAFIALGHQANNPLLEAVVSKIAEHVFHHEVEIDDVLLTELPSKNFFHGACSIQGNLANVLYFDDTDIGTFAMPRYPGSGEIIFARFSCLEIKGQLPYGVQQTDRTIMH